MLNIQNVAMVKVIAHHCCLIVIANINDSDVVELLMLIFVEKALDVKQNAKGHIWTQQQVCMFIVFLNNKSENIQKALDLD